MILESLFNLFKPKRAPQIEPPKSPFRQFLEKYKYVQGTDLLVLPEGYMVRSDINFKKHEVLFVKYLTKPAIIKS